MADKLSAGLNGSATVGSPPEGGTEYVQDAQFRKIRQSTRTSKPPLKSAQDETSQLDATVETAELMNAPAIRKHKPTVSTKCTTQKTIATTTPRGRRSQTVTEKVKAAKKTQSSKTQVPRKRSAAEDPPAAAATKRRRTGKAKAQSSGAHEDKSVSAGVSSQRPAAKPVNGSKTAEASLNSARTVAPGVESESPLSSPPKASDDDNDATYGNEMAGKAASKKTRGKTKASAPKQKQHAVDDSTTKAKAAASTPKEKALPKAKVEPTGAPVVWAESRAFLCETLPYYRAYQSGAYTTTGKVHALMLSVDSSERRYLDGEIVIARAGGNTTEGADGMRKQTKDHSSEDSQVKSFRSNMKENMTVVLIIAKNTNASDVDFPHEYNVMDHFHVTDVWAEKNHGSVCYKYRLQKVDLMKPSWWIPKDTAQRTELPDYDFQAPKQTCKFCGHDSKHIFKETWLCLNEHCNHFGKNRRCQEPKTSLTYSDAFIKERKQWPAHIKPCYPLKPDLLDGTSDEDGTIAFSRAAWKGMCCPHCGCCSPRRLWDRWVCDSCHFTHKINQPVLSPIAVREPHESQFLGHAPPSSELWDPVEIIDQKWLENWRVTTFKLIEGNTVSLFQANKATNGVPGGPDEMFKEIQRRDGIKLRRSAMGHKKGKSEQLVSHFSVNYGMHYKYAVAVNSYDYASAPKVLYDAQAMLTWGAKHIGAGESGDFNEMLAVGYFSGNEMSYHDDGEEQLGPTVSTLSLGCNAQMTLRMKSRYYNGVTKSDKYNPAEPVLPGAALAAERKALNALHGTMKADEFEESRKAMYKNYTIKKEPPVLLSMKLRHGDIVIMHGHEMQKYFEHQVIPKGNLRFALTCRYVRPSYVKEADRGNALQLPPAMPSYDGKDLHHDDISPDAASRAVLRNLLDEASH